jgi:predicted nicotinamide N-methyase
MAMNSTRPVYRIQGLSAIADGAVLTTVVLYFSVHVGIAESRVGLVLGAASGLVAMGSARAGIRTVVTGTADLATAWATRYRHEGAGPRTRSAIRVRTLDLFRLMFHVWVTPMPSASPSVVLREARVQDQIDGEVLLSGDAGYGLARAAWNAMVDRWRPMRTEGLLVPFQQVLLALVGRTR